MNNTDRVLRVLKKFGESTLADIAKDARMPKKQVNSTLYSIAGKLVNRNEDSKPFTYYLNSMGEKRVRKYRPRNSMSRETKRAIDSINQELDNLSPDTLSLLLERLEKRMLDIKASSN